MKTRWAWLKLAIAAVALVVILRHVDIGEVVRRIRQANPAILALAWTAAFFTYVLRALVLWAVAAKGSTLNPLHALRVNLIGAFFASVVPSALANDVVRGWYLTPYFPGPLQAVAAVVMQRLLGLVALATLASAALLIVKPVWGVVAIGILTVGGFVFAGLMRTRHEGWFGRIGAALRAHAPRTTALMLGCALAFASMLLSIAVYALAAGALHLALPLPVIFLASSLAVVAAFTPLTPAGLGMSEGAFVGVVAMLGGGADAAFAASAVVRLILMSISLLGGLLYLVTRRARAWR
jgi:uncharacterized membrane protein YbhN (UPF0104 family)